jgi:hypothetical protein
MTWEEPTRAFKAAIIERRRIYPFGGKISIAWQHVALPLLFAPRPFWRRFFGNSIRQVRVPVAID